LLVVHLDTTFKFKQIYAFRERYSKIWGLNLLIARNDEALAKGMSPQSGRFDCCNSLKTETLKQTIAAYGLKALLLAIRRDEHAIRAKERYFSARGREFEWDYYNQPLELWAEYHKPQQDNGHLRIHPLLHWREIDVWRYIKRERLPVVKLYFSVNGKRYRSIGCDCCCSPVESRADNVGRVIKEIEHTRAAERAGRAQDKEKDYMMQKLRSLGYM
jgi:sulfate adenylyltransferase subunit 2